MHVVFVCCGTRGDVQPCFCVALALLNKCSGYATVKFVTHLAHKEWARRLLSAYSHATPSFELGFLECPEVLTLATEASSSSTGLTRDETIIFGFVRAAARSQEPTLMVFNLFALEVAHMAEAEGLQCVAMSAYSMPHRIPDELIPYLTDEYPQLMALLQPTSDKTASNSTLSLHEVTHWAYPLFNEARWKRLRRALGLGAMFGMHSHGTGSIEQTFIPAIPLLYGFPLLVGDSSEWPSSVHAASAFWVEEDICPEIVEVPSTPPERKLVLIHFGSMRKLISTGSGCCWTADAFAAAVMLDLHKQDIACAYLVDASSPLAPSLAAFPLIRLAEAGVPERFEDACVLLGEVRLSTLLARCKVLIHHGGSGTTAAALRSGVPQIILPFMFDQYMWSDTCSSLGVSVPIASDWPEHLADSSYVDADQLTETLDAVVRIAGGSCWQLEQRCRELATKMRQHNAVQVSAQFLVSCVSSHEAVVVPTSISVHACLRPAYEVTFTDLTRWVGTSVEEMAFLHKEIYGYACYGGPPEFFGKVKAHLKDASRKLYMIDVGANIGFATRWIIENLIPEGIAAKVIAIEPASIAAAAFAQNLASFPDDTAAGDAPTVTVALLQRICTNQIDPIHRTAPIVVYPHLLGNSTARPLQMQSHKQALIARGLGHLFDGAVIEEVSVTTLSTVIRDLELPVVDFLKVDVEGSELEVLEGILPEHWILIQQVVLEVHDHKDKLGKVIKLLAASGYMPANTLVVPASHSLEGAALIYMVYAHR